MLHASSRRVAYGGVGAVARAASSIAATGSFPLITRALEHAKAGRTAIVVNGAGSNSYEPFSYAQLLDDSLKLANAEWPEDLKGERVGFLTPATYEYVVTQWATWRAGGTVVPLCTTQPHKDLLRSLKQSQAKYVVSHPVFHDAVEALAKETGAKHIKLGAYNPRATRGNAHPPPLNERTSLPRDRSAMIMYTSGTTGEPKGVLTTHGNTEAQVTALDSAWGWSAQDTTMLTLPLHHVHGVVNVVTCSLYAGATCHMEQKFDARRVWNELMRGHLTVYMAVPAIYDKLIAMYDTFSNEDKLRATEQLRKMRLMVSGSAALLENTLQRWRDISGHTLLERYGMTEIGMALSNPLKGERTPGHVGRPLPGVEARIVLDADDGSVTDVAPGQSGELLIRGPNVFKEYFNNPAETSKSFTKDRFFKTGDTADCRNGIYRILGRTSVDIIKNAGGVKLSAIEVENVLKEHPSVARVQVVGVDRRDGKGERVVAVMQMGEGAKFNEAEMFKWASARMEPVKVPREYVVLDTIPFENPHMMGKFNKKKLRAWLQEQK